VTIKKEYSRETNLDSTSHVQSREGLCSCDGRGFRWVVISNDRINLTNMKRCWKSRDHGIARSGCVKLLFGDLSLNGSEETRQFIRKIRPKARFEICAPNDNDEALSNTSSQPPLCCLTCRQIDHERV
jgi:hypothetical protein